MPMFRFLECVVGEPPPHRCPEVLVGIDVDLDTGADMPIDIGDVVARAQCGVTPGVIPVERIVLILVGEIASVFLGNGRRNTEP